MSNVPFQRTWLSPRTTEHYNFRRNPAFMEEERVPNVSTTGMPTEADVAKNSGVPPIAIPYMALQNLNRPDGTGKRIIVPMVTGFESTFLANSLQGLLCLPGCESVFMGEPTSTVAAAAAAAQKEEAMLLNGNEEEAGGMSVDEGDAPSLRSSSSPVPPPASGDRAASHASGTSSPRSASSNGSDINSLGPSGELDAMTTEEGGDATNQSGAGRGTDGYLAQGANAGSHNGGASGDRKGVRVLRGGIRCHGSVRIKTAVSRTYADFVLQHLEDGEIQLKTPAPRTTSAAAVSDCQLDDAGELETLRGQTPNVPRCLAPVLLPEERGEVSGWRGGLVSQDSNGGLSSSPLSPRHTHTVEQTASTTAHHHHPGASVSVVTKLTEAAKVMLTTSEHSCSDNSPTPSSGDDDGGEGRSSEDGHASDEPGDGQQHHHTASAHALAGGETRVGVPAVADGHRFTCFASNSVENMPEYRFPRLESDDLVELTAFMVVRSSVQPDEAVDLNLATHILGDPQSVARMPHEVRNALINRAARLMEAAVFLQI